jgi:NAD(P)-dependent dehydrogenase (short-subunit alcohol dehydrogenase family)
VKALVTKHSARVVVLSRNTSAELSVLASSPSLHFIQCDITQDATAKSAISETLKKFGRLDSIVLNAGTLEPVVKIKDSTATGWKDCFNVNVFCNIPLVVSYKEVVNDRSLKHSPISVLQKGV